MADRNRSIPPCYSARRLGKVQDVEIEKRKKKTGYTSVPR